MFEFLRRQQLPSLGIAASLLITGCASQVQKPEEPACVGQAEYQVIFNSTWSEDTHPKDFPVKPHYSHLFGVAHSYEVTFWEPGSLATIGIKDVAERGFGFKLLNEVNRAIRKDQALAYFEGNEMKLSPGTSQVKFQLNGEFSQVTLINMLAPSPDWITGVSSLNLCVDGKWVVSKTVSAEVYDAGTDDGQTYTAADIPRERREPVALLGDNDRSAYGIFPEVGTFEFKKI